MSNFGNATLKGTNFDPKAKDADSKTLIMKPYTRTEPDVYGIAFDYAPSTKEVDGLTDIFGRLAEEISYQTNVLAKDTPITRIGQWRTLAWRASQSLLTTDRYLNLGVRASAEGDRLHARADRLLAIHEMYRGPLKPIHIQLNSEPDDKSIRYEFLGDIDDTELIRSFDEQLSLGTDLASKIQTLWTQKGERHANDWFGRTLENRFRELSGICAQQHRSQGSGSRKGGKGSSRRQTAPSGGPSASNANSPSSSTQAGPRPLVVPRTTFAALMRSVERTHVSSGPEEIKRKRR